MANFRLIPAICALAAGCVGAEIFVAPDGSDQGKGTIGSPFASLAQAQRSAQPGDTVWIRGGTYRVTESQVARRKGIWSFVLLFEKSGQPGRPIRYWARAGETPVFDFSSVRPEGSRVHAFQVHASDLHFRGIEITGVQVAFRERGQSVCVENTGSRNVFERLVMRDGMAIGFYLTGGSDNLVLNCDAFRNDDTFSGDGRGGNVDGFGAHPRPGSRNNVFRGCRAWLNSDDGFDAISAAESVTFENCWAMRNGVDSSGRRRGDGNGFKVGGHAGTPPGKLPPVVPRHLVRNCLASQNPSSGFYSNHSMEGSDWVANSAFRNGTNFNFLMRKRDNLTDIPGRGHRIESNLGFRAGGGREVSHVDLAACSVGKNSFSSPMRLRDEDFLSLDVSELTQPRRPDGSLPILRFLVPKPSSPAAGLGRPASAGS